MLTKTSNSTKLPLKTTNLTKGNIEKLSELFPNLINETKKDGKIIKTIDVVALKELVGDYAEEDAEIYSLNWVGKRDSKRKIAEPITKTLRPVIEDSVDFENTKNLYIEGDNFEVLKLLRESYLNSVKMIYIDPPYNTGKDFVYKDNFRVSKEEYDEESGAVDEEGNKLFKNTTTNGRFHSDWISMMYERLTVSRDLLKDDGIIFISIDDNEVSNLRKVCDEIFGEENFIAKMVRRNKSGAGHDSKYIAIEYEYCLFYSKNIDKLNLNQEMVDTESDKKYSLEDDFLERRGKYYLRDLDYKGATYSSSLDYQITLPGGEKIWPGGKQGGPNTWRWSKQKVEWGKKSGFIVFKDKKIYIKQYQFVDNNDEVRIRTIPYRAYMNYLNSEATREGTLLMGNIFSYPKPVSMIKYLLKIGSDPDSLILDFFSGSATTAHAVMQLNAEDGGNRRYIMVQISEETDEKSEAYKAGYKNICEIGKERIRRAAKKIKEDNKDKDLSNVDFGFKVFRADSSNMKDVYYNPKAIDQRTLGNFKDNIKEDRTPEDLIYQVLLSMAIPLDLNVKTEKIGKNKVFVVKTDSEDVWLSACFDENIDLELVKEMSKLNPQKMVFRDSSFKDDKDKVNCEEFLKHQTSKIDLWVI